MADALVPGSSGQLYAASLLGYGDLGAQGFSPDNHARSARTQHLARLESYFRNRQHDDKTYAWNGTVIPATEPGHQPRLSTAKLDYFPDLHERRPVAPYRLAKFVVRSFTSLLFGEGRFPEIRVLGDPDTQDYVGALAEAQGLPSKMKHARDVGGSSGVVGVSWRFWDGLPRTTVHPGSSLHVQEWEDPEQHVPRIVSKISRVQKEVLDPKEGLVLRDFWRRRDWTPVADVVFVDQEVNSRDKEWVVDESEGATVVHGEGFCHFVWIQNQPDFDGDSPDGEADYAGNTEPCDALDVTNSATAYGGAKNIEPTLVLQIDEQKLREIRKVTKGSDRALPVGKGNDVKYLEVSGASIAAGIQLVGHLRSAILECCQVVAPDPDKVAAAGSSSVALKMLYAPMLAPAAGLRETYGRAIVRLLDQQLRSIRMRQPTGEGEARVYPLAPGAREPVSETDEVPEATERQLSVSAEETETIEDVQEEDLYVDLPPRVVEELVLDPATKLPTGEKRTTTVPRKLGAGGSIQLAWPDWFEPTADDRAKDTGTLSAAAGGRPVISQESAVERAAQLHKLDPEREWQRVAAQQQAEREAQAGMYPSAGIPVEDAPTGKPGAEDGAAEGVASEAVATGP